MEFKITGTGPAPDPHGVAAALRSTYRWVPESEREGWTAHLMIADRNEPAGMMEWGLSIYRPSGERAIYIGLIQRRPGAGWESHS